MSPSISKLNQFNDDNFITYSTYEINEDIYRISITQNI